MATPVEMPQLGTTVEECIVTRWVKRKGDVVSTGDVVAEIETDKTTFEVTAPVDGTVLAMFFEEGALVPVFTNILVIGKPGESVDAFRPGAAPTATAAEPPAVVSSAAPIAATSAPRAAGLSPRASKFAAAHDFHPASIVGSGPLGRVLESDVRREYASHQSGLGTRPSTLLGTTLSLSKGRDSGLVESTRPRTPSPEPRAPNLRGLIARRMRESLASTAQYTMNSSADATGLLALRARIKSTPGLRDITINDLVAFCAVQALRETPDVNAEFVDGKIVKHSEVHLGFAVDTPRGLIAPVVRHAHKLPIVDLASRMKELTTQSIQGTISADDLSGATFTISNLGSLGIESFTPLINPPQVAILGVGAIQLRPVRRSASARSATARSRRPPALADASGELRRDRAEALAEAGSSKSEVGDGAVEFADSIGLSLTCDHQVIDGAPGARFLQSVRDKIERVEEICKI